MSDDLIYVDVTFHTSVIPADGWGREGYDISVNDADPIGGDRLKGLMRASATHVLNLPGWVTDSAFGSSATPSPWAWSSFSTAASSPWRRGGGHRVAIDPERSAATVGSLVQAERIWTERGRFYVSRQARISAESGGLTAEDHACVLRLSAAATKHMGTWRRRGFGWITMTPTRFDAAADLRGIRSTLGSAEEVKAR